MSNKEKSLEFLTHALAEVGFSPAHARRACLATNLAGVPQAIEWALAHLDEESDPQSKNDQRHRNGNGYSEGANYSSGGDNGLVVELPDGKLFRLTNPNGRVVEMPNGSVVEMIDGQVVEMSNGQQLEMVDGSLLEIRPATIALDDGEIVGHRILDYELSRQVVSSGNRGHAADVSSAQSSNAHRGGRGDEGQKQIEHEQEERARRQQQQQMQQREEQLKEQAHQLSQRDKEFSGKQQQLAQHQQGLHQQEQDLSRRRLQMQVEQENLEKKATALKKKEQELMAREAKLERMQGDMSKQREQLKLADKELKDREETLRQAQAAAQANGASASSTVRQERSQARDNASDKHDVQDAMENIEAGRIRFSELTLGSLLGSGSFADVYRAEWRMPCAVKKMKGRISKEQMTEFVREGEMMRSLKHPGIVKLLGVCVENGSFYLVQEIVNGYGNLFDYLHKKNQRLTYWQCVQIAIGICDAMAYLHERHIVHRDLKPQNCLLVNDRGEVKLCDFGLARLKNTAFVETVSNTAGTPAYQAPEMLRDEPISEKVDLYGFGIMLWEMYTGKLPWSDKNYHQMIHTVAVRNERPPISSNIPRELVQIIEGCWHPLPQKRPLFSDLKTAFRDLAKTVPQDIPTQQGSKHMASTSSAQMAAARGAGPNIPQPQAPSAQPGQQYYMQQQQQQQQQQRAPGMAPQYQGAPQQPVMYGGFQHQQGW